MRFLRIIGASALQMAAAAVAAEPAIERLGFGSCARQDQPQPVWDAILERDPDLFVLAGDNVYADTTTEAGFHEAYRALGERSGFQRLRQRVPILATWDDHDYGANDAGADFPARNLSERVFLDFFGVDEDDPRRHRPGIYTARRFGPAGQRVQVVLLDTRYFRSTVPVEERRYRTLEAPSATMLGAEQWRWLEGVLERPAALRLIVSSTQVLPDPPEAESWSHMPQERERLLALLESAGRSIIVSGDRHFGEILKRPAQGAYPIYEVTASGLNAAGEHWHDTNPYRLQGGPYPGDHFGEIGIDWEAGTVALRIVAADGAVVRRQRVALDSLAPGK